MKESELEKILVEEVRKAGGKALKWVSPGNVGVPDRIVLLPGGRVYFVELKTETGKISPQQMIQIRKLRSFGQTTDVVRGIGGLAAFFRAIGLYDSAQWLEERYGV